MPKKTIFISSVKKLFCPSVVKVHDTGQATVQVQNYSTAGMNNASLRKRIGMHDKQGITNIPFDQRGHGYREDKA